MEQISLVSKIVHLDLICPWPFDNRDLVLVGRGFNLLAEQGVIVVALRSPTLFADDEPFLPAQGDRGEEPEEGRPGDGAGARVGAYERALRATFAREQEANPSGRTRMEAVGHVVVRYIAPNRCFCQVQMKVDVKLKYLPAPLLNFVTRTVASTVFSFFKRRCVEIFGEGGAPDVAPAADGARDEEEAAAAADDEEPEVEIEVDGGDGRTRSLHRERIDGGGDFYAFVREALAAFEASIAGREACV